MKIFKKLFINIITFSIGYCILSQFTVAQTVEFPYNGITIESGVNTNFENDLKTGISEEENGVKKLLKLFMPNEDMIGGHDNPSLLFYLKTIVNLLLSFVSLIALILIIYTFYMIFFKKGESDFSTAKQMIKGIVIALFVIGLSRIVVSFLYRLESENTQNLGYQQNSTEIINCLT